MADTETKAADFTQEQPIWSATANCSDSDASTKSQSRSVFAISSPKLIKLVVATLLSILFLISLQAQQSYEIVAKSNDNDSMDSWRIELRDRVKEQKIKIVALVFYGRMPTGSILNSYLEVGPLYPVCVFHSRSQQRDLKRNGGLIDEVQFLLNADKSKDVNYLAKLVARNPEYNIVDFDYESKNKYMGHYEHLDRNTLYIKMDDDVVYIDDLAVEHLISEKLRRPRHFLSANVINHPLLT